MKGDLELRVNTKQSVRCTFDLLYMILYMRSRECNYSYDFHHRVAVHSIYAYNANGQYS